MRKDELYNHFIRYGEIQDAVVRPDTLNPPSLGLSPISLLYRGVRTPVGDDGSRDESVPRLWIRNL